MTFLSKIGLAAAMVAGSVTAASAFTACQVTDTGGIDDAGFNQTAWKGVEDAMAAHGIEGRFLESTAESDYEANLNSLLGGACDVIVTVGFLMGDATATSAAANPDQKYSIVDFAYDPDHPERDGPGLCDRPGGVPRRLPRRGHDRNRRARHLRRHQHPAGDRFSWTASWLARTTTTRRRAPR